ncbi:unnamed protein product [Schistosoma margrebowiei]|uniref:Uncharacterized protein n=1 Tax=Schistosoma margrebowiei TaxID=48269 RepID=A0AA85AH48_9TREM|nr:unnamed protein product [Schistosoma margrebowiei]
MKRPVTHAQVSQWEAIRKKKRAEKEKIEAEIRRLEAIQVNGAATNIRPENEYLQQTVNVPKRKLQPEIDLDNDEPHWFSKKKTETEWSPITTGETEEVFKFLDSIKNPPTSPIPIASTSHQENPQSDEFDDFIKTLKEMTGTEPEHEEDQLWTIVYRGPPPKFVKGNRINTIIINHFDHYHFVFQSSIHNRFRTMRNILNAGGITCDVGVTLQAVRNWHVFMAYLVRKTNYTSELIGIKLKNYYDQFQLVTLNEKDCSLFTRESCRESRPLNNNRMHRRTHLMDLVTLHNVTQMRQFKHKLSAETRANEYDEYGKQWEETALLCIEIYNETNMKKQMSASFLEWISENHHEKYCYHPDPVVRCFF